MNAEMIAALREIENERNISFESLLEALEAALISAYKRNFGGEANAIVTIDRQTGDYQVYHRRTVVEDAAEITDPKLEIPKAQAGSRYEPGDFYDEVVTPRDFGRIAAQTAKQVIVQRIREAERDTVYNTYSAKLHDIVLGTVQRYEQRNMFVLLDDRKTEALLPFSEQVPRENYRINDRIRAYVLDVRKTNKGPLVVLSRAAEGLVQRLIEFQVPEIQDDIVEIMAIAREPGARTKVAVTSKRPEIDAVGACLGPKSSRIANVSDELRGEKIDVIRWAADLSAFIANALAPAKVLGVELYEDDGIALVIVPDHQLSLAIGREGQNVRLAARLTGWRMDITSDSEAAEARERYQAEREARAAQSGVVEGEVAEDEAVAVEGEEPEDAAIDQDELLRRLEEFKREMFTNE
ncbi:MAG: transcription termination factor NusA [Candidatus Eremiobacteraeota bacterium]|nr:transcription termination factor NusA [Candidatus Eremiobacteraeota bacterium]